MRSPLMKHHGNLDKHCRSCETRNMTNYISTALAEDPYIYSVQSMDQLTSHSS